MLVAWKKSYKKPRQHIKKQKHHFVNKGSRSQSCGFSCSHVWMWEFYHKKAERQRTDTVQDRWPHPEIFNLVTCAKTIFPSKVPLMKVRSWTSFEGIEIIPVCSWNLHWIGKERVETSGLRGILKKISLENTDEWGKQVSRRMYRVRYIIVFTGSIYALKTMNGNGKDSW